MTENRNFYIYVHLRKTDDTVFYVGKGTRYRLTDKGGRNQHWHNTVNKHGFIAIKVMFGLTCSEANEQERELIKKFRDQGVKLCNKTDGGEGALGLKHSEETKRKLSILKTGIKYSAEATAKKVAVLIGRKPSALSIQKLIERNKTMVRSEEAKKRYSESRKGKSNGPHSEETKRKMSEAKKLGWAAKKAMLAALELAKTEGVKNVG